MEVMEALQRVVRMVLLQQEVATAAGVMIRAAMVVVSCNRVREKCEAAKALMLVSVFILSLPINQFSGYGGGYGGGYGAQGGYGGGGYGQAGGYGGGAYGGYGGAAAGGAYGAVGGGTNGGGATQGAGLGVAAVLYFIAMAFMDWQS